MPGNLYVVATPIGNLEDISQRALRVLSEAPVLACEDTRHTGVMLKRLGVPHGERRFIPYHDANERRQAPYLLRLLREGHDVAIVTNAGTPLVSDPGFRLVAAARAEGITVVPVPGACAAIAALSASGLPSDRFCFFGFLPPKPGKRRKAIESAVAGESGTAIFYVPARALEAALRDLADVAPAARVVVARELTKVFEEFVAGTPAECLGALEGHAVKGEVTLLVHP